MLLWRNGWWPAYKRNVREAYVYSIYCRNEAILLVRKPVCRLKAKKSSNDLFSGSINLKRHSQCQYLVIIPLTEIFISITMCVMTLFISMANVFWKLKANVNINVDNQISASAAKRRIAASVTSGGGIVPAKHRRLAASAYKPKACGWLWLATGCRKAGVAATARKLRLWRKKKNTKLNV